MLFIQRITSKFEMEWHERWSRVVSSYLKETGNDLVKAKRSITRAILYYRREGKPIRFIINLMWGGIFIGCLSDQNFQKALMAISVSEIFKANLFGAVCLVLLPFICIYYCINYKIPAASMENVIAEIELEE